MGEIRLICPGCEAEYRLPEDAIPATGREVECTACGRVWQAGRDGDEIRPSGRPDFGAVPGTPRQDIAQQPAGPLSRRLPDSVLSILRDEVEHERRARMAEDDAFAPTAPGAAPPAAAKPASPATSRPAAGSTEGDWPATTVTATEDGLGAPRTVLPAQAPDRTSRAILGAADLGQTADPGQAAVTGGTADDPAPGGQPAATDQTAGATILTGYVAPITEMSPAEPEGRSAPAADIQTASAYRMGLGVAAMIAAVGLALYLLAPGLADAGPLGEALAAFRGLVDGGRAWIQAQTGV